MSCLALLLTATSLWGQTEPSSQLPEGAPIRFSPVDSSLEQAATDAGFVLGNTERAINGHDLRIGDELTFHAELREGEESKQWLIRSVYQGEVEGRKSKSVKRFASTGEVFEYGSTDGRLQVTTIAAPHPGNAAIDKPVEAIVQVKTGFLGMGFHDCANLYFELNARRELNPDLPQFWFYVNRSTPVDRDTVAQQQSLMETLSVKTEQLRAAGGMGVAFDSFVNLMNKTPGISDILWEIAKKPSAFSMFGRGISTSVLGGQEVSAAAPEDWNLPKDTVCFRLPLLFSINGRDSLRLVLFLTEPKGPLQQAAGVFGLVASPPDEASNKELVIRLAGVKSR